ncbi:hypothetical protein CDL15_Pgr018199 [Punica granatum]|uniref:Auxin efflux carrier component n=1 Tax=Punica granatum TaxID=22663 RepID=A0A218WHJ4_PUNGR|nr:hypothetical protein CDL15_Pgr018199 [Punica granatum]
MYEVLSALVPLYMAMFLAFRSVQWWGMSTPMQCVGINRYVAMFAVPVHGFNFIATSNLYEINYKFIAADTIQKVAILLALGVLSMIVSAKPIGGGRFGPEWSITLFSLSSLPNTLIFGIPLLEAMYGKPAGILIVQVIVFQSVIWYNLFRLLFEYRAAKILINECFPGSVGEITSIRVDSDVVSLSGIEPLEMDVDRDVDGRFHVGSGTLGLAGGSVRKHQTEVPAYISGAGGAIGHRRTSSNASAAHVPRPLPMHPTVNGSFGGSDNFVRSHSSSDFDLQRLEEFGSKGRNYLIEKWEERSNYEGSVRGSRKVIDGGEDGEGGGEDRLQPSIKQEMPPMIVMMKLILLLVWRKLIRNPNTYACILGAI